MGPNKFKIFIASSDSLEKERRALEQFFHRQSETYENLKVFFEPVIWENLPLSIGKVSTQEFINEKMLKCDMVIAIFFDKVGDFT